MYYDEYYISNDVCHPHAIAGTKGSPNTKLVELYCLTTNIAHIKDTIFKIIIEYFFEFDRYLLQPLP